MPFEFPNIAISGTNTVVMGKWHFMCRELCVMVSRNKICELSAKMIY